MSTEVPAIHKGLVTTIIPVYNRPSFVKEAIKSVLAQSYQSLQIIVVDDGSTDKTPKVLKRFAQKYDFVTVIRQKNAGPGVARQRGLEFASGEYVQFLDSDDLLLPQKFTLQVAALKAKREAVAAYGKTELVEIGAELKGVAWKRTGQEIDRMFPLFLNERWWGTSSPLYRHKALRKLGPILPLINEEDWEYDCRLAARGGVLAFVDEFLSTQRRHDSHLSAEGGTDKQKLQHRCIAREAIYKSAKQGKEWIEREDMELFSKATFLLARQCAAAGLTEQVHEMLRLSIKANKGSTRQHEIFVKAGNFLGWRTAGFFAMLWQRLLI